MAQDIGKALAYQVKREIAERYFGIRKIIEDDSANLQQLISRLKELYNGLAVPLLRIYILLGEQDLAEEFCSLVGWKDQLPFFDREKVAGMDETVLRELFENRRPAGWFATSKYADLLLDAYRDLYRHYLKYRDLLEETEDELAVVQEEINMFRSNYSLDDILTFLSELDRTDMGVSASLESEITPTKRMELEKKMALPSLDEIRANIPELPDFPEPDQIKSALKTLAKAAYNRDRERARRILRIAESD